MRFLRYLALGLLLALGAAGAPSLAAETLDEAVSARIERVPEFRFIREEAAKLGVRVWLFGGTAAGFGHYVKWDLRREGGDPRFQPNRFDYDYTNIYRSTQDLDIVIDGTPEQVASLQNTLETAFPHFQGSRSAWEVRSLRQKVADKEPLLNNPDFLHQHTDSNSTGMIELSRPPKGEPVVRDLRMWESAKPAFLSDLEGDKLHFYFSPSHFGTNRAKEGLNPPILSALRYLTKAFQYELDIDPASLAHIQKIVADFDPKKDLTTDYAHHQLEKNAKKMVQHAVNLEYARGWLDRLGLREKLMKLGDVEEEDSMAWWLNKMPLQSRPLGEGPGKTAAELARAREWPRGPNGEIVVSHETNNYLAYESITRAHTGEPNVLISRRDAAGEMAAYGDGFYTRVGREGARGTGLTIRFHLDPRAREGSDFVVHDDYVVLLNKQAVRVVPESLNLDPAAYFRFLAAGEGVDASDRALMEKLGRRVRAQLAILSDQTLGEIEAVVDEEFAKNGFKNEAFFSEWFRIPRSVERSERLLEGSRLSAGSDREQARKIVELHALLEGHQHWRHDPRVPALSFETFLRGVAALPYEYRNEPGLQKLAARFQDLEKIPPTDFARAEEFALTRTIAMNGTQVNEPMRFWFAYPWAFTPAGDKVVKEALRHKPAYEHLVTALVGREDLAYLRSHPEILKEAPAWALAKAVRDARDPSSLAFLDYLIDADAGGTAHDRIMTRLGHGDLSKQKGWAETVDKIVRAGQADREVARLLGHIPQASSHSEWVEAILARGKANPDLVSSILTSPQNWKPNARWMNTLLEATRTHNAFDLDASFASALATDQWRAEPEWRQWLDVLLAKQHPTQGIFYGHLLGPADIDRLLTKDSQYTDDGIVRFLAAEMEKQDPKSPPEFRNAAWVRERLDRLLQRESGTVHQTFLTYVLSKPEWQQETGWIETILRKGYVDPAFAEAILSKPFSAAHPEWLMALLGERPQGADGVAELNDALDLYVLNQPHWTQHPALQKITAGQEMTADELRFALRQPDDPAPVFGRALGLARAYQGEEPARALQPLSAEDLALMANFVIPEDHDDARTFQTLRNYAQQNLAMRKDPRVKEWLREDLGRTKDRRLWAQAIDLQDPALERLVLDEWKALQPFDTPEKHHARSLLLYDLNEGSHPLGRNLQPIALEMIALPGKDNHSLRYRGLRMLENMDLAPDPELRRVLLHALEDANEYIREAAIMHLERIEEKSPAYVAKMKEMFATETYHPLKARVHAAWERVSHLGGGDCAAKFNAL